VKNGHVSLRGVIGSGSAGAQEKDPHGATNLPFSNR
jgi:hypothetical protein